MVGLFEAQLVQRLFTGIYSGKVKVDGVKHIVVSNATFNQVVLNVLFSFATGRNIVKPFSIIFFKALSQERGHLIIKLIDINHRRLIPA